MEKKINIDIFSKRIYFPSFMFHPFLLAIYKIMFILSLYYIQNMEKMQKKKEIELHAQYSIIIKKFIFF